MKLSSGFVSDQHVQLYSVFTKLFALHTVRHYYCSRFYTPKLTLMFSCSWFTSIISNTNRLQPRHPFFLRHCWSGYQLIMFLKRGQTMRKIGGR